MVYLLKGFKPTFPTQLHHVLHDGCFDSLFRKKQNKTKNQKTKLKKKTTNLVN